MPIHGRTATRSVVFTPRSSGRLWGGALMIEGDCPRDNAPCPQFVSPRR